MDSYLQDFRYTIRSLRNHPGFSTAAVLTLVLGIGACTTIFSVVNTLLLTPLPGVRDIDELVAVHTAEGNRGFGVSSYADFLDLRDESDLFASLAAFKVRPMDLGLRDSSERITGLMVTSDYFGTLGVDLVLGRTFLPAEDQAVGAAPVAVLSHGLWSRRFGGRNEVLDQTIRLNGREFRVVGVAPEGFRGTMLDALPEVFVPMAMQPFFMPSAGNLLENRSWCGVWIAGRPTEGVGLDRVQAGADLVARRLAEEYPQSNENRNYSVARLGESSLPPEARSATIQMSSLLMVCVMLFLLIACVNVANLMLARATRRVREVAMRMALGANRARVVRQLLIESAFLSLLGGAGGILLAVWGREMFRAMPLPGLEFAIDWRVLCFTLVMSLGAGLVFGLAPALRSAGVDLIAAINLDHTGGAGGRARLGGALVVLQVAVSVVLLVAAGLFVRTLHNLNTTEIGMEVDNVLVAKLDPALQRYEGDGIVGFYERVLSEVSAVPGVSMASVTSARPGGSEGDSLGMFLHGRQRSDARPDAVFNVAMVGADYFDALRIPRLEGRTFSDEDAPGEPPSIVVNESGARLLRSLTGEGSAVGILLSVNGRSGPWSEVIGVVGDSKTGSLRSETPPFAYGSHAQLAPLGFDWPMNLVVRTEVAPLGLLPAVREKIRSVDPYLPIIATSTLESYMFGEALTLERLSTLALGLTALLALLMAAIGLFGVVSYSVSRRWREIGIRRALGASTRDLLSMVIRQGMRLVAVGVVVGAAGALAAGQALSSFLYELSPADPLTILFVVVQLTAVALLACWLPARKAARIDPMETLRIE
ncbi:MAG: ABC transporter permease [Thermoanaerobaculia bacterium]|nr:ABC transporter permease [Thermoanaerobaculia bacterium]